MAPRDGIGDGSLDASGRELLTELGIDRDELQWRQGVIGFEEGDEARVGAVNSISPTDA